MSQGKLTKEEISVLKENPNVTTVTESRIMYTEDFKALFMEKYLAGAKPTEIFVEAGFDKKMLGFKRIERAAARWRQAYEEGKIQIK